jgi:hypothetical protein
VGVPDTLTRWPLLAAAVTLTGTGVAIDVTTDTAERVAIALLMLAGVAWGAFVYAEGARHREWWAGIHDAPAAGVEPGDGGEAGKHDRPEGTA